MPMASNNVIPFRARHIPLPAGDAGIQLTINEMRKAVLGREGAMNPQVRVFALNAIRNTPDRDDVAQASALYKAVKEKIRFRGEYSETVQTPLVTLQLEAGDCDDHSTLLAALLRSVGIPARFDTVATPGSDGQFSHVFVLAGIRKGGQVVQWMPLDTTVPQGYPGWRVPMVTREKTWGGMGAPGDGDGVQQDYTSQPQQPQIGKKAADASAIIQQIGQSVGTVVASFKNRDNTTTFSAQRYPGGFGGSVGTSPTTLAVGGIVGLGLLYALMRRR